MDINIQLDDYGWVYQVTDMITSSNFSLSKNLLLNLPLHRDVRRPVVHLDRFSQSDVPVPEQA